MPREPSWLSTALIPCYEEEIEVNQHKRKKEKGKSYLVVHEGFEALEGLVHEIMVSLGSKADTERDNQITLEVLREAVGEDSDLSSFLK